MNRNGPAGWTIIIGSAAVWQVCRAAARKERYAEAGYGNAYESIR